MSKKNRPGLVSKIRSIGSGRKTAPKPGAEVKPEVTSEASQEPVDAPVAPVSESSQVVSSTSVSGDAPMITLKYRATKKNVVLYSIDGGLKGSVRFLTSQFTGTPPTELTVNGDFAQPVVKAPKAKLTKEQRAALPKPTLAEKIAKRESALAAMKAKLNKEGVAASV